MNIVLIGFRCTGKSSVGRRLAERLGMEFIDSDEEVALRAGMSIEEVFEAEGEPAFRRRESAAIAQAAKGAKRVISTGGGAVLRYHNVSRLRREGVVILLESTAETIVARMKSDPKTKGQRPRLAKGSLEEEVKTLLARRERYYRRAADATVATDGRTVEQVVRSVIEALKGFDFPMPGRRQAGRLKAQ